MKICVIGTGYVGLVTGTCLAELGNNVICVDIKKEKIEKLKKGIIPIYEPGLEGLVKKNFRQRRLLFENSFQKPIQESEIIFIAVGTPSGDNGEVNLNQVKNAAEEIGKNIKKYKVIVNKSTMPVGSADLVKNIIGKYYKGDFDVISNPEFLREGSAVFDFMEPDRIVIGSSSEKAYDIIVKLYKPLGCPILTTNLQTAEMIKYASNAFLASEISFINALANICEKLGVDVTKVAEGMKLDNRIGKNAFLNAGLGYGGSCFPKDIKGLISIASKAGYNFKLLKEVEEINEKQKENFILKIKKLLPEVKDSTIGIWGLAFKPNTDDIREAPSIDIISQLLQLGTKIKVYDPVAEYQTKKIFPDLTYCSNVYQAAENSNVLLIITDWSEFIELDKEKIKKLMKEPNIIDGRNIFDPKEMKKIGFNYLSIGR